MILGTSVAVSIFTLMAGEYFCNNEVHNIICFILFDFLVSIDRFIAIQKPMHSKLLCTPTRVLLTIGLTWAACKKIL